MNLSDAHALLANYDRAVRDERDTLELHHQEHACPAATCPTCREAWQFTVAVRADLLAALAGHTFDPASVASVIHGSTGLGW